MGRLASIASIAKGLPTALAAVLLVVPQTKQAISTLLSLTTQDIALLLVILPVLTVLLLLSTSTPRSTISSPGNLVRLLRAQSTSPVTSHGTTAFQIVHECLLQQQIFVVGPAGIGKSTLVRNSVLELLEREETVVPIYLKELADESAMVDRRALMLAVHAAFRKAGMDVPVVKGDLAVFKLLDHLASHRRVPVIIFDHFDDYLAANLRWIGSRDPAGSLESVITSPLQSAEIRKRSTFWNEIAERVAGNSLRTVYVTTPDVIAFVSCFRFGTRAVQRPVFELPVAEAEAYLTQLEAELGKMGSPIKLPDDGWSPLKRRLLSDLAPRQTCLPHQLSVTLQGLASLPFATLEAYKANGGLQGLGALTIGAIAEEIANSEMTGDEGASWSAEHVLLLWAGFSLLPDRRGTIEQALAVAAPLRRNFLDQVPAPDDPRWRTSIERLRSRRLVRLRLPPGTEGETFELRLSYAGNVAKTALERRAPVEARLAVLASFHSASSTWAEWWRTLLPVPYLAHLAWARVSSTFRFSEHRKYAVESTARVAVLAVTGFTYVLLADAGMTLPFGDALRKAVDSFGVTIFRQPSDPSVSIAALKQVRDRLGEIVVQRCQATKWCHSADGTNQLHEEPWATSQALAAVMGYPAGRAVERAWLNESLAAMFESKHKVRAGDKTVGWTLGDLSRCPVAEPSLWMGLALARASGSPSRSSELSSKLTGWNTEVDQAVNAHSLGSAAKPAPLIEFVANTEKNRSMLPSVYATSLSLLRDIDRAGSDRSATHIQRMESTVAWLLANKRARSPVEPADGWQAIAGPGQSISAGVTMQVLYGLLRARTFIPKSIPEEVERLAIRWLQSFETENDPFLESVSFQYGECLANSDISTYGHVVRFLWYPWALGSALELYQYEDRQLSRSQMLTTVRALEHFQRLATASFPPSGLADQPTYKLSEFLFAMSSAK